MPDVDVVIPCYRYGRMLPDAVASVLDDQPGCNVRVVIVDDASGDGSAEVARELAAGDPRIRVVEHEVNRGHLATFSEAVMELAEAEYTLLLSADDAVTPGALTRATALLDAHPNVGFVYGNAPTWVDDQPRPEPSVEPARNIVYPGHDWLRKRFVRGANAVPSPSAVTRTAVQRRLGGYDSRLPHTSDLEMWMRFALHSDVGFITADQAYCREHGVNMSEAYNADGGLADLQHRLNAFVVILEQARGILPDSAALDRRVRRALAGQALLSAGRGFDGGRTDRSAVAALVAFAEQTAGSLWLQPQWHVYNLRRTIGPQLTPGLRRALISASGRYRSQRVRERRRDQVGL